MSWSYSGDPSSSPKDEVRFLISDTDTADQQLSDEEINYNLKLVYGINPPASGNFLPAAYCADGLRAKFTRTSDKTVGDLHVSYGSLAKQYADLNDRLRQRATMSMVPVYAGGQSKSEKAELDSESDRTQATFKIDGMTLSGPVNAETGIIPGIGP